MNGSNQHTTRVFPPLYVSTGDASVDRLAFFHIIEALKTQKRTGWVDHNIPDAESISDHMYRMSILSLCSSDTSLDIPKCVMLSVVHDLAEAQVGDIAPRENIPKAEKRRLETEAMKNFCDVMLHGSPAAKRIEALWKEYEDGATAEAKFVKDLDRIEMCLQATEYERRHRMRLDQFFQNSTSSIQHKEVKEWAGHLMSERAALHSDSHHTSDGTTKQEGGTESS